MTTLKNNQSGEVATVASTDGYDLAQWTVIADPPSDASERPYRLDAGGNWIPVPAPTKPPVTAYEIAVAAGFVGNEAAWLASLRGADGARGPAGIDGAPGPRGNDGAAGATGPAGATGATGPAGTSNVSLAVKLADEGRVVATYSDDLTISLAANSAYEVDVLLAFNVASIAADAKWQLTGPAGAVLIANEHNVAPTAAAFGLASSRTVLVASIANYIVRASGVLTTTAAGTLALQWAQNTATAGFPTTLKRGSRIELVKVA